MKTKTDESRDLSAPYSLRCEYTRDPVGLDIAIPRFSWFLDSPGRSQRQTRYQIHVATSHEELERGTPDCWDSGEVESDRCAQIEYAGSALDTARRYVWRCRAADGSGAYSPWSEPATFITGLFDPSDWSACWIEGGSLARTEFEVDADVALAVVSVTGLGYYELRLNGRKVGDHVLDPGWTDYDKSVLYSSYDVTEALRNGKNALALMLGNGRYNPPKEMVDRSPIPLRTFATAPVGIVQVTIRYTNGRKDVVVSDGSWRVADGPIVANDIWDGETYDATREFPGWDTAGFDDHRWIPATESAGPAGRLISQSTFPPIRVAKTIRARRVTNPRPGVFVFDFEQNFAGWVRLLRLTGPRGTRVRMRFAEVLDEEGMLNTIPNREADATDTYIMRGGDVESYEPRFTYHGFRYCELTGCADTPRIDDLEGCVIHTDVEPVGSFSCSNQMINDLHRVVLWSQLSNLMSVPTDCPQRDERMGWMGDAQLTAEEATHNFFMPGFYSKYMNDISDAQLPDGQVSDVIPAYWQLYPSDPAWGTATIVVPWTLYQHYGDARVLSERYDTMKKWVEYLRSRSEGDLLSYGKFGDWCPPQQVVSSLTPLHFTSSWYYYHDVLILSKIAKIVGNDDDETTYGVLAEKIKSAFNARYLQDDRYSGETFDEVVERMRKALPTGEGGSEDEIRQRVRRMMSLFVPISQTANTLPLYLSMVPEQCVESIVASLVSDISDNKSYHLNTGIVGTRYIFEVLTRHGHADVAYKLITQHSYPSWGYMLREGATTLWERWEELVEGGMNSHNHIMYGSFDSWFYRFVAGIDRDPDVPAFRRIRIRPHLVNGIDHADGSLRTVSGTIRSSWRRTDGGFELAVTIPVGTSADVWLPSLSSGPPRVVDEGDTRIWDNGAYKSGVPGVSTVRSDRDAVIVELDSGTFTFAVEKSELLQRETPSPTDSEGAITPAQFTT